jgi:hypothetical protein
MVYGFVKYGTVIVFVLSLAGHIFITSKNISIIDRNQTFPKIIFKLLIYPVGIWTIQEALKQK